MTAEFVLGHVGIVLDLKVSRLARNNSDWYRLLDLCGVTNTLIGDTDGINHSGLFNDRLVLCLKLMSWSSEWSFERFSEMGSARRVWLWLRSQGLRFPARRNPLGHSHLCQDLRSAGEPLYGSPTNIPTSVTLLPCNIQ